MKSTSVFRACLALLPALLACELPPTSPVERQHLHLSVRGPASAARADALAAKVMRAHGPSPVEPAEEPQDAPSGVVLDWDHEGERVSDGFLSFTALNLDDEERDLEVTAIGDRATISSRALGPSVRARLAAKAGARLEVELDPRALEGMEYSGFVAVHVSACPTGVDTEVNCQTAVSAPMFFHPVERGLVVYGEELLLSKYRSGDYRGTSDVEPGTLRVMGGGPILTEEAPDGVAQ
ncbi:hypothetical protein L6R52_10570 [Myxococcota bacterium]|nr:hypothetical protein [Myxococcota bacterium]